MSNQQNNVFLIGFMGCGKTSLGKQLSNILHIDFIDLDNAIEEQEHETVFSIINTKGESYFRELERKKLLQCLNRNRFVMATGGGTPCFFDNIKKINTSGTSFYIELSPAILLQRITDSRSKRPLVFGKTDEELQKYIVETLQLRESFYKQAHHCVNGQSITAAEIAKMLKL